MRELPKIIRRFFEQSFEIHNLSVSAGGGHDISDCWGSPSAFSARNLYSAFV